MLYTPTKYTSVADTIRVAAVGPHVSSVSTSGVHERCEGEAALLAKDKVSQIHQGKNVNTHLTECSHTRWVGQPQSAKERVKSKLVHTKPASRS